MSVWQAVRRSVLLAFFGPGVVSPTVARSQSPYPPSPVITSITWAPTSTITSSPPGPDGSDNWPTTWADDGNLYTAYGDGVGFPPYVPSALSLGFASVSGPATAWTGTNIRSPTGEQYGAGAAGKKASGMLMVNGVLYMWVRNASNSQLAWSSDHAQTWTWSSWLWTTSMGFPVFLNFGQNYAGARDNYVYVYSPDGPDAYTPVNNMILARVPQNQIATQGAYQFFTGFDASGNPLWSSDITQRAGVFTFANAVNRLDVVYNAPLQRYLMTMRSRAPGVDAFGIYDAPQPWGPWYQVFYVSPGSSWDVDPGESQHFPSKWISADGKTLYLVYSGGDTYNVRQATLTVAGGVATHLAFTVQPSNTASGAAITPAVQITAQDASGSTATGFTGSVTVAIGTNPAGGTLAGTTSVAAVSGVATFSNLSIDKAGTGYTLTAAATGLTGATSTPFNVAVGAVSATQSSLTAAPTSMPAGSATSTITVTARDAGGNAVSGATVVLTATGTGNTLTQPAGPTGASGVATGTLSSTVAEPKTISATINGTAVTQTAAVMVTPGPATSLSFLVQPSNVSAAAPITPPVQVQVRDASGNRVTNATNGITLAIGTNPAGGTLAGTTSVAAVSGVATFSNLSIDKAGTGYTLTGAATGLTGATSTPFNVAIRDTVPPAPPTNVRVVP